jgi:hypothetical protein
MQKFAYFVPTFPHHLKPLMRDNFQSTCLCRHPRIDGWIPLDGAPLKRSNSVFIVAPSFSFRDLWGTWHLYFPSRSLAWNSRSRSRGVAAG